MSEIIICDTSFFKSEVMKVLSKYLPYYGFRFTVEPTFADVMYSVHKFPEPEKYIHIPKVKQVNPISDFHILGLKNYFIHDKKDPYIRSFIPNKVIADSSAALHALSSNKALNLTKEFDSSKGEVIKYWPDPEIFYPSQSNRGNNKPKNWVAVSHYGWESSEARAEGILRFAEFVEGKLTILGELPDKILMQLHDNCVVVRNLSDYAVAATMREADACICFDYELHYVSYLVKALACGLPILVGESIKKFDLDYLPYSYNYSLSGSRISYFNLDHMPDFEIEEAIAEIETKYEEIRESLIKIDSYAKLHKMVFEYGNLFQSLVENKKYILPEYTY